MDHFRKIEKDFKNFNFYVGLSEPLSEDNWSLKNRLEDDDDYLIKQKKLYLF